MNRRSRLLITQETKLQVQVKIGKFQYFLIKSEERKRTRLEVNASSCNSVQNVSKLLVPQRILDAGPGPMNKEAQALVDDRRDPLLEHTEI